MSGLYEILSGIGFAAIIGGLIYIGRKLQVLDDVKITVDKLKNNVQVISNFLIRNSNEFDPSELQTMSPMQLTQEGKDFVEHVGFEEAFQQHKDEFFTCISSETPALKYDVETAAIRSIYLLADKEFMGFLKEFFYNNPKRTLENTAPTLGVYVRDAYLEAHPEIVK